MLRAMCMFVVTFGIMQTFGSLQCHFVHILHLRLHGEGGEQASEQCIEVSALAEY